MEFTDAVLSSFYEEGILPLFTLSGVQEISKLLIMLYTGFHFFHAIQLRFKAFPSMTMKADIFNFFQVWVTLKPSLRPGFGIYQGLFNSGANPINV